jgi:hypothetical protein
MGEIQITGGPVKKALFLTEEGLRAWIVECFKCHLRFQLQVPAGLSTTAAVRIAQCPLCGHAPKVNDPDDLFGQEEAHKILRLRTL